MKKLLTFAAIAGCAALSACGGGTTEDTVSTDNGMMMDNLGTTDMNAMDTNMDINMDMNGDMNASGNAMDNGMDAGNASENTL